MKLLLFVFVLLACTGAELRKVRIKEIGWTFSVPPNLHIKDSAFDRNGNIKPDAWEVPNPSFPQQRVSLVSIESSRNNYFNSIVYIDSSDLNDWKKKTIEETRFYIEKIGELPNYKLLDTTITTELIDGVGFQKEYFKLYNSKNNITTQSYKYSRRYKNYSINYNIRFIDTTVGKQYLQVLKTSSFDR